MTGPRPLIHWAGLSALVVFWGSSFAMTKVAVESLAPIWVVALRLIISLIILAPFLVARGERLQHGWRIWIWYAALGALGNTIPFFLISWGTVHIDSGLAGILMSMVPLMVISLAHMFIPGEQLTMRKTLGFALGFSGVVVLIGPASLLDVANSGIKLLAQIAILGATLCYALHSIGARLMPPSSTYQTAFSVLLMGVIFSLPLALYLSPEGIGNASNLSLFMTLMLGIFPTALASLVLFRLISEAGPSFVSLSNYLIPAFALITGVLLLGEQLSSQALAGFALILMGIWISQTRRRSSSVPSSS